MVSLSITSRSYIEQLERKARFLEVINSFASELMKANTVDEVVWTIAKQAIGKMGYLDCIVYLLDEQKQVLIQRAAHGPKNPVAFDIDNPIRLELGQGICGNVALTGRAEIVNDTRNDSRYHVDDQSRLSEITVPIVLNDEVIGVIDSEHPASGFYSEEDLKILTTIASMAATKIDQARIKENLELIVQEKTNELSKNYEKLQDSYAEIIKNNKEKETLLKEIHHRVKNNLQVISSLLNLQSGLTDDQKIKEVFDDSKNRIASMAAIHEQLYEKDNLSEIDARKYVADITQNLIRSYASDNNLNLHLDLEALQIDLEKSVPLGLILNELIVNVLKHAFPKGYGKLEVSLKSNEGKTILTVKDDGIGFDVSKKRNSLGVELVYLLAEQLGGETFFSSGQSGTKCEVIFL